jgi:hypothetical protein
LAEPEGPSQEEGKKQVDGNAMFTIPASPPFSPLQIEIPVLGGKVR